VYQHFIQYTSDLTKKYNSYMTNQKAENFSKCNAIYLFAFQNSKRVLRSNEVIVPPGGLLDTELDLSFSLQVGTGGVIR